MRLLISIGFILLQSTSCTVTSTSCTETTNQSGQSNGDATCTETTVQVEAGSSTSGEQQTGSDGDGNLQAPTNLTDGTTRFTSDVSPDIEWDSVSGAVAYEVALGTSSGATDIAAWSNVGNVNVYQFSGLSLTPGTYYASVRAVGPDGATGPAAAGDGWQVTACPAGYIPVPGNTTAGLGGAVYTEGTQSNYNWSTSSETIRATGDFCVMKYEAKDGGSNTAVSEAAGLPWVFIVREQAGTNNDAQDACENNGAGFQLIGNHHWQAIARNIESVPANFFTGTTVDDYKFNRGHSDNGPTNALAADADDANACVGVTSNGNSTANCGGGWHINKRTHLLSNGETIWDFSGNVFEWVRDNNSLAQGTDDYMQAVPYTDALKWGPANDYSLQVGADLAGLGFGTLNDTAGAVVRGGSWSSLANGGLFQVALSGNAATPSPDFGFRCVYAP